MSNRQSVDLDNRGVNIDDLRAKGWEPTANVGSFVETENRAAPDDERLAALLRLLEEINASNPLALNVLLHSVVGAMNEPQTANALGVKVRTVTRRRAWLRVHYPALASCLNGAVIAP